MTDRLSIKNLKIAEHLSQETLAYSATVYLDGKPVLYAENAGHGGEDMYLRHTKATQAQEAEVYRLAVEAYHQRGAPDWMVDLHGAEEAARLHREFLREEFALETLVHELIEQMEVEKQYRRWCKTKIVFRLDGDPEDQWRQIKAKYSEYDEAKRALLRETLAQRYPGKTITILNERYT